MRLGLIVRDDNTGLGNQTRELYKMLNPDKILVINSEPFNNNKQNGWYADHPNATVSYGFLDKQSVKNFLEDLDVVFSCEIFYHNDFTRIAKKRNVKTILQYNYEFLDYLKNDNLVLPDVLVSPSMWHFEDVKEKFGQQCKVVHLPPPSTPKLFPSNMNLSRNYNRILHIAGKVASKDRNGTQSVIDMLKYSKKDYELVIKVQGDFEFKVSDSRVTIDDSNPDNHSSLYEGFDLMLLPRRYAGLCLPMNEALLSALPVFMTNISPNNYVLPEQWLVPSNKIDKLMTRTMLDVYSADPNYMSEMVDRYMSIDNKSTVKEDALILGTKNFAPGFLIDKYQEIIKGESI